MLQQGGNGLGYAEFIATVALAIAGWSAWQARRATRESSEASKRSLRVESETRTAVRGIADDLEDLRDGAKRAEAARESRIYLSFNDLPTRLVSVHARVTGSEPLTVERIEVVHRDGSLIDIGPMVLGRDETIHPSHPEPDDVDGWRGLGVINPDKLVSMDAGEVRFIRVALRGREPIELSAPHTEELHHAAAKAFARL